MSIKCILLIFLLKKFLLPNDVYDSKGFAKEKEVAKINKVVVELTSNCNLGVDKDAVVLEELTNAELLELEQEYIVEKEAKRKGNCRRKIRGTSKKIHNKGFSRSFCTPTISSLKLLKT